VKKLKGRILSSEQASIESQNLPSIWSRETHLTQRTLIYVASLLEKMLEGKPKRKPSEYQRFISKEMKAGRSMKEAVTNWTLRKTK
jgi:hypothetical protein